mmetsp:Transcript_888/g.2446  ORF Transcript_888/g.2446 Transcript_888/m.2446 type:complete len:215 (+) Transcript_888:1699-2343(+)
MIKPMASLRSASRPRLDRRTLGINTGANKATVIDSRFSSLRATHSNERACPRSSDFLASPSRTAANTDLGLCECAGGSSDDATSRARSACSGDGSRGDSWRRRTLTVLFACITASWSVFESWFHRLTSYRYNCFVSDAHKMYRAPPGLNEAPNLEWALLCELSFNWTLLSSTDSRRSLESFDDTITSSGRSGCASTAAIFEALLTPIATEDFEG